jgi:hypothetical protein
MGKEKRWGDGGTDRLKSGPCFLECNKTSHKKVPNERDMNASEPTRRLLFQQCKGPSILVVYSLM